jgi:hypothetical protein
MWFWPKWKFWVKILLTLPLILIPIILMLLPFMVLGVNENLEPLSKCVSSCNTTDLNSPCLKKCQEDVLNNFPF